MFDLKKESNTVTVDTVQIGYGFRHEGEICVRIKVPKSPPVDPGKVLAISIETWELRVIDPSVLVDTVVIHATSRPMGHE